MSWATIRDGMKARLDTISGLQSSDVYVEPAPNSTFAMVVPGDPLLTPSGHRGKVDINIIVRVQATRATLKDSQDALDPFLWPTGASSIVAAVEGDKTLDGAVDACQFVGVDTYGPAPQSAGAQADVRFRAKVTA